MGIFTRPKDHLEPKLFTKDNVMFPHVRELLLQLTYTIFSKEEIENIYVLGSSIGYKWDSDADIDLNVILKENSRGAEYWHPVSKTHNGSLLKGTFHPINFFVQNYSEIDFSQADFEVYDLTKGEWIKPPSPSPPNPYDNKFAIVVSQMRMTQLTTLISQLETAYNNWRGGGGENWRQEIFLYLNRLIDIFREVDKERKLVYNYSWGVPRYSAENIVFKYIDKNDFIHLLDELKDVVETDLVEGPIRFVEDKLNKT